MSHGSNSEIQTVRISRLAAPEGTEHEDMAAPCLGVPQVCLGAKSPFGLSLPDATPSPSTMYAPRGVWLDPQRLIVCDSGNHRVLIWNTVPTEDGTPADIVLGQSGFHTEGAAASSRGTNNGMRLPTGVIVAEGKLLVADAWHHRILVWNTIPTESDTPPDYAIGQADLSQVEINRGGKPNANTLYWPYGIAWINDRFYVTDTGNRRVLIWNQFPASNEPADIVLGQDDMVSIEENRGRSVAADSFRWPHDIASVGEHLFVADAGNHRILKWPLKITGDQPADSVLGQKNFESAYELPYDRQGAKRLRFPYSIDSSQGVLAAADTANNRVLFWRDSLSSKVAAAAFDVIGQPDFASNGENQWDSVQPNTLCWPYGISFSGSSLAIADSGNNRVVIWNCQSIIESVQNS